MKPQYYKASVQIFFFLSFTFGFQRCIRIGDSQPCRTGADCETRRCVERWCVPTWWKWYEEVNTTEKSDAGTFACQTDRSCRPGTTRSCYPSKTKGCETFRDNWKCTQPCSSGLEYCIMDKKGCRLWSRCVRAVTPQPEKCNNKDDNCNGQIDESLMRSCGSDQGECQKGSQACKSGKWQPCAKAKMSKEEICDGKDNDCDGQVDEDFQEKLYKSCSVKKGLCQSNGVWLCKPDNSGVECKAPSLQPIEEKCDGKDNDCNGKIDDLKDVIFPVKTKRISFPAEQSTKAWFISSPLGFGLAISTKEHYLQPFLVQPSNQELHILRFGAKRQYLWNVKVYGSNIFTSQVYSKGQSIYALGHSSFPKRQIKDSQGKDFSFAVQNKTAHFMLKVDSQGQFEDSLTSRLSPASVSNESKYVSVDSQENYYLTGNFIQEASFKGLKLKEKIYSALNPTERNIYLVALNKALNNINFFIEFSNTVGRFVWLRGSLINEIGQKDRKIYLFGEFEEQLNCPNLKAKLKTIPSTRSLFLIRVDLNKKAEDVCVTIGQLQKPTNSGSRIVLTNILMQSDRLIVAGYFQGKVSFPAEKGSPYTKASTEPTAFIGALNVTTHKYVWMRFPTLGDKNRIHSLSLSASPNEVIVMGDFINKLDWGTGLTKTITGGGNGVFVGTLNSLTGRFVRSTFIEQPSPVSDEFLQGHQVTYDVSRQQIKVLFSYSGKIQINKKGYKTNLATEREFGVITLNKQNQWGCRK